MTNSISSDFVQQESYSCPESQIEESRDKYKAEPEQQLPQGFFFQEDKLMWRDIKLGESS